MRDLSITQEYMICTVNNKGALPAANPKAGVCLVVGGLLELQLEQCISMDDKKVVTVCAELPERMFYLKPLYDVIHQGKPMDALMESLKAADVVEPVKAGLFGNKEGYAPKKEVITGIIEKIRAELLEDGELSEDILALTILLDKSGQLKEYFSKFEQKELKGKLNAIRKSKTGTTVKDLLWYIDSLDASIMISTMISSTM